MANNILKEAIADAKAVREVALANAKAALEEAFTPKLQSMLSAKLSQTLDESEEEEEVELDEMTGMDDEDTIEEMDMYDEDDVEENLDEEIDLEEILNELELDEDDSEEEEMDDMVATLSKEESMDEGESFNLDILLEQINNLEEQGCGSGMVMNNEGQCMSMKEYAFTEMDNHFEGKELDEKFWGIFHKHPHKPTKYKNPRFLEGDEGSWDDEQIARSYGDNTPYQEGNMMSEGPEIFTAMAGLAGLFGAAGITTALELAAKDPEFQEKHPKAASALEKIFGFMSKMGGAVGGGIGKDVNEYDLNQEVEDMAYEELRESRKALNTVKSELNEVNLLNSKLLYVNRIFKANTLDESQKLRVVENLDKANSVKEAKLIYETIKDTFTISKGKKTAPKKSIREGLGMASKAAGMSTAPKRPILNESNDMVARMQKLANITIKQ